MRKNHNEMAIAFLNRLERQGDTPKGGGWPRWRVVTNPRFTGDGNASLYSYGLKIARIFPDDSCVVLKPELAPSRTTKAQIVALIEKLTEGKVKFTLSEGVAIYGLVG